MTNSKLLLTHIFLLLPIAAIQSAGSIVMILSFLSTITPELNQEGLITNIIFFAIPVLGAMLILSKLTLFIKGKMYYPDYSDELYFNPREAEVRLGRFKDRRELPAWQVFLWFLLSPIVIALEVIALIMAILSIFIEPIHATIGENYIAYPARYLQKAVSYLFGFVISGITLEKAKNILEANGKTWK